MTEDSDAKKFVNEPIPPLTAPCLSKAAKRKLKNPQPVITPQMKEEQREALRDLRKRQRQLKSNGGRTKVRKEMQARKREREEAELDGYHFDETEMRVITEEEQAIAPTKKKQRQEPVKAASPVAAGEKKKYPGIVIPQQAGEKW